MRLIYSTVLIFYLGVFSTGAQSSTVSFYAPEVQNDLLSAWVIDDYITNHRHLIATEKLVDDSIRFTFDFDHTTVVRFQVDYQFAELLVQPGKTYRVVFESTRDRSGLNLIGNTERPLIFLDLDSTSLNFAMIEFAFALDSIISNETISADTLLYQALKPPDLNEKRIDSILMNLNEQPFEFDEAFRLYYLALTDFQLHPKNRKSIFKRYIFNRPILYNQPLYMQFIRAYYRDFFDFYTRQPFAQKMANALDQPEPLPHVMDLVQGDTLTGNQELQWLILQIGLYDLYAHTDKYKTKITGLLNEWSRSSPYPEQQKIAAFLADELSKNKRGSDSPELFWTSADGLEKDLTVSKKYKLIQFFATWSVSSEAEMELMMDLQKKYDRWVDFISLSIDKDKNEYINFVSNHPEFKWEMGWVGENPQTHYDYEIYNIPLFYLVDPENRIVSWPSLWPSSGVESMFMKIKYQKL